MILKKMTYNDMIRMVSVALLVGAVVAAVVALMLTAGMGASVVAADDAVETVDELPEDLPEPDEVEVERAVSDEVYLSGHEWDDGDVVLSLVVRSDGQRVRISDEMDIWTGRTDGYDEVLTLDEGEVEVRVPDAYTYDASRSDHYGVIIYEHGGSGVAPASGTVGLSASLPAPPVGPATVFSVLLTAVLGFASTQGLLRRYADVPEIYDIKPKLSFWRWIFG